MNITGNKIMNDYLAHYCHEHPKKTMILSENQQFSYSEFDQTANRLANAFERIGLTKGDRAALFLGNRPEFLVALWAMMKLGVIAVPINTLLKQDEVQYNIAHTEAKIAVTGIENYSLFKSMKEKQSCLETIVVCEGKHLQSPDLPFDLLITEGENTEPAVDVLPDDILSIIYTSGTTSRPKGVMLSHRHFVYGAEVMAKTYGIAPEDRVICVTPIYHTLTLIFSCMPTIALGGSIVLLERFSATRWWKQIEKFRPTWTALTGSMWRILLRLPEAPEEENNTLSFCNYGLPCSEEEFNAAEQRFGLRIMQAYGMTETFCSVSMQPRYGPRNTVPSCIGYPTIGQEIRIADETGKDVLTGEWGEILIKTLVPFVGYYKDPEATAKAMVDGWLHSGDIGFFDESGCLHFADRKKDMIKPKGENVAASEIERVLLENQRIEEVAVIGLKDPDDIWGEKVKAYIVLKEGQRMTSDEVIEHCEEKLADFKVPRIIEFRSNLPKTSIGKINKKVLSDETVSNG